MKLILSSFGLALVILAVQGETAVGDPPVKAPSPSFQKWAPYVDASFELATARRGQTISWKLTVQLVPDIYTFSARQPDNLAKSYSTRFSFPPGDQVVFVGDLIEPMFKTQQEPAIGLKELRYFDAGILTWTHSVVVHPEAVCGKHTVKVQVQMVVCDHRTGKCLLPNKLNFELPLTITNEDPVEVDEIFRKQVAASRSPQEEEIPLPSLVDLPPRKIKAKPRPGDLTFPTPGDYKKSLDAIAHRLAGNKQKVEVKAGEKDDPSPCGNLEFALREAQARNRLVFLNFTAVTDTNAAINENVVFTKKDVKQVLDQYQQVFLDIARVPDRFYSPTLQAKLDTHSQRQQMDGQANSEFLQNVFQTVQEPYYLILKPLPDGTIQIVSTYEEGKINDVKRFIQFLKEPLQAQKK